MYGTDVRGKTLPVFGECARNRLFWAALLCICAAAFALMAFYASTTSLWLDDMYEVEYCRTCSFAEILRVDPLTPPLFNALAWAWYRIVPFGELWLRLPCMLFAVGGIWLCACAARRAGSRLGGLLAAGLLAVNPELYAQCALVFRGYGLVVLLSALCLYLYARRCAAQRPSWGWSAGMGFAMLALGYTHYFGVLLCCAYFAVDVAALARGRLDGMRMRCLLPYAIACVGYLPWAFVAVGFAAQVPVEAASWVSDTIHWQSGTQEQTAQDVLSWIAGGQPGMLGAFYVACIACVLLWADSVRAGTFDLRRDAAPVASVLAVWMLVGGIWAYSTFVNTLSVLWVQRYFAVLIPSMAFAAAWALQRVFSMLGTGVLSRCAAAALCVALVGLGFASNLEEDMSEDTSTRFYRGLTAYLEQQGDILDDKTAVLAYIRTTDRGRNLSAWKHYYFCRKDTRSFDVRIIDGVDPSVLLNPYDLLEYDTLYVTEQHLDKRLPSGYEKVLERYYRKIGTQDPGGGFTQRYVKKARAKK